MKPCPFCGSRSIFIRRAYEAQVVQYAECRECRAKGPIARERNTETPQSREANIKEAHATAVGKWDARNG